MSSYFTELLKDDSPLLFWYELRKSVNSKGLQCDSSTKVSEAFVTVYAFSGLRMGAI